MKKYLLSLAYPLVLLPALCFAEQTQQSEQNYYVSPQIGISFPNSKAKFAPLSRDPSSPAVTKESFKNAAVYGLTVGKKIYENSFVELELAFSGKHKFSNFASIDGTIASQENFRTKLTNTSVFVNLSYQFKDCLSIPLTPYILAGLGYSNNKIGNTSVNVSSNPTLNYSITGKSKSNFAWQLGAGALFPITSNIDMNLTYKFRSLGKAKSSNTYNIHNLVANAPLPLLNGKIYTSDLMLGVSFKF